MSGIAFVFKRRNAIWTTGTRFKLVLSNTDVVRSSTSALEKKKGQYHIVKNKFHLDLDSLEYYLRGAFLVLFNLYYFLGVNNGWC